MNFLEYLKYIQGINKISYHLTLKIILWLTYVTVHNHGKLYITESAL